MKTFQYLRPASLAEALDLLARHGPAARLVAGGTDVMVDFKKGGLKTDVLVSLRRLTDLRYIREGNGQVHIGGLTTLRDLERSSLVARRIPGLADAAKVMASVQIRNVATVAGNICNAAPSADTAPPLLAAGTQVRLVSPAGSRDIPLDQFFTGPRKTIRRPDEILTEFVVPIPSGPYSQAFWKHARRKAMDLAMVSVAVHLELEDDLVTCRQARIAHGVAAPTPIRTPEAEERLKGKKISPELLEGIGEASCEETLCRDSIRGQAWYREEIIRVMVRRMTLRAMERCRADRAS
jgi:carbon-monoxide dehydrogenase medium subunit